MKPTLVEKTAKPATKAGPKVFDISHPGKGTAASATARPVIVGNRPILQDPMLGQSGETSSETMPGAPKLSPAVSKITIQPLSDDEVAEDSKTIGGSKTTTPKSDNPSTPPETDKPEKAAKLSEPVDNSKKTIAELAQEAISGKSAKKPVEVPAAESKHESETKPEPGADSDDKPAADAKTEPTKEPKPKTDEKPKEAPVEAADDSTKSEGGPDLTPDQAKEAAELEAEAKKQEAINALIDGHQYFLPINAVERHRSKVISVLGLLLIVALGLLLLDLLLDVGVIRINGVHALTHFFSA